MTWVFLLPLVLVVVGVTIVVLLFVKHLPQVRLINVHTDERAKAARVKEELLFRKAERALEPLVSVRRGLVWVWKHARRWGRISVQKLRALEERYERLKHHAEEGSTSTEDVRRALDEAAAFMRAEEWEKAEERYIEIISHHPRLAQAYEYLGRLYTKMKQFPQALESLQFAQKLRPNDASVQASLGEVYAAEGQWGRALEYLARAVERRPGNPRYLDAFIETALEAGNAPEAARGITLLRRANPENQKIEEFEKRLSEL